MTVIEFVTRGRGPTSESVWNPGERRTVDDNIAAGFQQAGVAKIVKAVRSPTKTAKAPEVEQATAPKEEVETEDYRPRRGRKPQVST
jgi:hypothetical protein